MVMWRGTPKGGGVWGQCSRLAWHDTGRRSQTKKEPELLLQGERKQIA